MAEEQRKLYEISEDYRAMVAGVQIGEMSMEELGVAADILGTTKAEITRKVEACMRARRNLEMDADTMLAEAGVFEGEIARLKKAAAARKNEATRLNDYVAYNLELASISSVKTNVGTVFLRRTTRLEVASYAAIPDEYLRHSVSVDKSALKKAVEAGEFDADGVHIVESTSVGIR